MATSSYVPSRRQLFLHAFISLLVAISLACNLAPRPSVPTNPVPPTSVAWSPAARLLATEDVPPQATEPNTVEAITWIGIGPWVNINALVIDPGSPSIIYAGTDGGMFKSTNHGESWRAVNAGLGDLYIEDVAMNPITPTIIYAAVGYSTPAGGGVFKSMDGGNHWAAARNGLPKNVARLAIDPLTPTTLYVVTYAEGVFKSTNGGESWSAVNTGLAEDNPALALEVDPLTPSTLYLGTYRDGVYKSTDSGSHWSAVNRGINLKTTYENSVDELVIDPITPTTLYALTRYAGIYKSTNGGQSWSAFDNGVGSNYAGASNLMLDSTTPTTIYIETDELYKSTDGGKSWQTCNITGLNKLFISVLAMDPVDTSILYIGTHGGGLYTNRTYAGFVSVHMPSLTPPPPAATEAPVVAVPVPTEAPVVAVPAPIEAPEVVTAPTLYIKSTLAPLEAPFTVLGHLNFRKDTQLPENARILVLWYVIAEEPQYIYVFGEGNMDIANNSFELVLDEPPPSEALNWIGSASLGVGLLIITTNDTVQTGKMNPEAISETNLLGASGQYSIIYVNNGFEIGEFMPWYNEFNPGYSAGRGLDDPDSVFDQFEPVDPTIIEIIIDDMENIQFVNWF